MREKYQTPFADQAVLREMLTLRASGWKILFLSERYGADRKAIRFHCERYGIMPQVDIIKRTAIAKQKPEKKPSRQLWMEDEFGDRIFLGKDYATLLRESIIRENRRRIARASQPIPTV